MLDLAAFYAPRGITPEIFRQMPLVDRAVLREGRARWYEDNRWLIASGIALAYNPKEEDGNG